MNIKLYPNDPNIDFSFVPPEIYKSSEDIKLISFNEEGSIVIIVTKGNEIRIFDYLGRNILFSISHFVESASKITSVSWTKDSKSIYVTYENPPETGYQRIDFNFHQIEKPPFSIPVDDNDSSVSFKTSSQQIRDVKVIYHKKKPNKGYLYISGTNPSLINIETKKKISIVSQEKMTKKMIIILKEAAPENSFFLIIKELYLIFYIKPKSEGGRKINTSKMSYEQIIYTNSMTDCLNKSYVIFDVFGLSISGEVTGVQLNEIQSLMLINSSDRVLRLYRIVDETIQFQKDYSDSVNKKRWINSYFYTFKIKKGFQDLIITALCDSNSLEFTFIDIEKGKILKKLDPFKYTVQDFICHYKNHFSLLLVSNKKLFNITGYMVNQWGCFAPGLSYIEENIEYIEDESFFDKFEEKMKENIQRKGKNELRIQKCFSKPSKPKRNFFFELPISEDDPETIKSQNELKELFSYVNEEIE